MKSTPRISPNRPGLALPMTIIAVAGLTLLLVGLLTVLTLERKTARSYSNAARADLAVESGLAVALGTIAEIAKRDDSIVFRVEDPTQPQVAEPSRPLGFREQFFTYGAVYDNGNWRGLPLFSGSPEIDLGDSQIDAETLNPIIETYTIDIQQLGRLTEHDQNIPRAQWVDVPATDPKGYDMRYAFWIEDLSGRIDARAAGSLPRGEGASSAEIDYATILQPIAEVPIVPVSLTAARDKLRSSASIRPLFSSNTDEGKRLEPYIYFFPEPTGPTPAKVVPQGFGYADAGQPAPDLNELIDDKDIDGISSHIARNLPNFQSRKGGFPASEDYLKTLAASFIDYADEDNNATIGPGYRGVDSYPFVNELFDRYEWVGGTANTVKIEVETYVELWNPSNQSTTGTVFFKNENKHEIRVPPGAAQNFASKPPKTFVKPGISIPPNGFFVISLGTTEFDFPTSPTFPPSELIFTETLDSNFDLKWNGRPIDRARGGLQRTPGNLRSGFSKRKWKGNSSPALDYSIGQTGDPRASYYIDTWVYANSYDDNSNWGGRCLKKDIGNSDYNEVRLAEWLDSGTDSTPGVPSGTDARVPTATNIVLKSTGAAIANKTYPENEPEKAPAFISNSGRYDSVAELGNIFDPAQFTDVNSAFPVGNSNSGGGFSLAIGRPEFGAFDKEGQRSAQLLDLFSVQPEIIAGTTKGIPVNINTAPREVLRTLIAGVTLDADPATPDPDIPGGDPVITPKDTEIGDIFADFVIAQRAVFPLRGFSDLNNIRKDPTITRDPLNREHTPFFGSRDAYKIGTAPPESWDDAGREELLRKTLNLVNFTSKKFRIVVAGEARDQNGQLKGRTTREYHYTIEPQRDPTDGSIVTGTDGNAILNLTKHYEKSF